MKYKIIFLIAISLGLFCQAQNRVDKQGRRQGHWIKTDKDGSKIFEGTFEDGKETGEFKYYYPNGTIRIRNTFTTPGKYCRHEAYDEAGHLLAKGFYEQHNRDGEWRFYNEKGRLVKIATYRMGIKEGLHVVFDAQGDTAEVTHWKDNQRHGRWWKRIGEKGWITAIYNDGLVEGKLVEYNEQGELAREGFYKNGFKEGSYRFYESGKMTVDETWRRGVLADKKILIHTPEDRWISAFQIAYFLPRGSKGTTLYTDEGDKFSCTENYEDVNWRVGNELFVTVDAKSHVTARTTAIVGLKTDADGRTTLELTPVAPFTIFPSDDCIKMIRSLKRVDMLDE